MTFGTLGGCSVCGNNGQPIAGGVAILEKQMKQCGHCEEWKPETEFNKNRAKPDGLQGYCRKCQRASGRKYAASEKGRETRQTYLATPEGKEMRRKTQARYNRSHKNKRCQRRYNRSEKGKAKTRRADRRMKAKYPARYKARKAVNHAVENGDLPAIATRHCAKCGDQAKEYHHHKGYSKEHWLDVIPVCYACHN